ncbi:MAG: trigger factor [Acidimicrobiales bacterium]
MRATAAPVEGNRVRLSVELDEDEVDKALTATVRRLARDVRVPGFRPGRVPRPVLEARLGGAEALRQQAISDALPDLYARAVVDTEVDPIAAPEIDITSGETEGPLTFDALVEVRPSVSVAGYGGLVVTVPATAVSDEEIDAQIDRVREQSGELEPVGRPARDGDYLTIDLHGRRPGGDDLDVEDFLYEVGSGSDIPELDDQLRGASTGDILQFSAALTGPEGDEQPSSFRVLVKDVKHKVLPEADDTWAAEASEFDTVAALRDDLATKLRQIKVMQAQVALRTNALGALVELVQDDPPQALVDAEVRERLHDLGHRLEQRHLSLDQFLQASGRDRDNLLAELQADAGRAVRADLALRALAEAENLEVSDEDLEAAVAEMAAQAGTSSAELHRRLDRAGRLPAVRSDQRKSKALEWLIDNVALVDDQGTPVAREDLLPDTVMQASGGGRADVDDETGSDSAQGEDVGIEEGATVEAEA